MKKAFTIIGLFTLMLVVTSFTTPNEIGGGRGNELPSIGGGRGNELPSIGGGRGNELPN